MATKNAGKKILTLILMMLSLNTIYVLPYLMYTYYTPLQEAMGLIGRDADYGRLLNLYGIANIILYLPGGWMADKFDSKNLLVISMVGTGALGIWESFFPSYGTLQLIFVLYAVTSVLTYWSASIKCINVIAASDEQGGMFGMLEAGRGIVGLVVSTLFASLYGIFGNMTWVVRSCGLIMVGVGVLMFFLFPKTNTSEDGQEVTNKSFIDSMKAYVVAFTEPTTYLLAGMIFFASLTGAALGYFGPYLENMCGMSTKFVVFFQTYSKLICQIIGASLAAFLATKMGRSSKPLLFSGCIAVIAAALLWLLPAGSGTMLIVLVVVILIMLCFTTFRGLYYAVIEEAGCPKHIVGSVVGIASILGFCPDTFYSSMAGGWRDAYGDAAFKMVFATIIGAALLGTVCAFICERRIIRIRAQKEKQDN